MENNQYSCINRRFYASIFCALFSTLLFAFEGDIVSHLNFKKLPALNNLPTDEIQKVYQDKDGFIWLASRYGFYQYDGYEATLYKSNLYAPGLLTNNNILCLVDDYKHNLWIGTQEGLNILNKKTGEIRKILAPEIPNNVVSCLLVTRDHSVWLGTDSGLCKYIAEKDSFVVYHREQTDGVLDYTAIKSLFEDSEGDLWIGTWSSGLYRYVPSTGKFYAYPQLNERNSAHVIYEDTNKNIWVGSWNCGLFKLNNPKDLQRVSYVNYRHKLGDNISLSDDIVYDISEDLNTNTLWVGTRSGLSIMSNDTPGHFINYKSRGSSHYISCDEINSIIRDNSGMMWLGSIGGGVLNADTHQSMFTFHSLNFADDDIPTTSVRSLFTDSDNNIWMGIGTYGLACLEYATGKLKSHSQMPEFTGMTIPTVFSVVQRKGSGEIWFGTYDGGIFAYHKGQRVRNLTPENCKFLGIVPREEMVDLYNMADVLFVPSYNELFPMTILEAVNLHVPLVLRDLDLYKDILFDRYMHANDNDGFKNCLLKLKNDSDVYAKYQNESRLLSEFYSKEHVLNMWREFYLSAYKDKQEELLNKKK